MTPIEYARRLEGFRFFGIYAAAALCLDSLDGPAQGGAIACTCPEGGGQHFAAFPHAPGQEITEGDEETS